MNPSIAATTPAIADSVPRVTLIMTVRERFQLTLSAIESVMANTSMPFRFVFAAAQVPEWLRPGLAEVAQKYGISVVHNDLPLWPQEIRKKLAPSIDTEYVVFLDNDLLVYPDWLEALVRCADETGAGLVGPLYLWGGGKAPPRVHMAGGTLDEITDGNRRVLSDKHIGRDADPQQFPASLGREPCDFLEFHCMLFRTDLAQDPEVIDDRIVCIHEHIDVALTVRKKGYAVLIDFGSRVLYRAFTPISLEDLAVMRQRWTVAQMEKDIATFCAKWNVISDHRSFDDIRYFMNHIFPPIEPVRFGARQADLQIPMQPGELVRTGNELLDLAAARGYSIEEIRLLCQLVQLAQSLMNGGYRPCGRPFLNHLVGTAGVLLRFDFRMDTVLAGLLHASYTHGRLPSAPGADAGPAIQKALGGMDSPIEGRVRAYTFRAQKSLRMHPGLTIAEAEIAAIAAANEIDMRFSGEYDYSGRAAELDAEQVATLAGIMRALGVTGLADTLCAALQHHHAVRPELVTGIPASYRLGPDLSRHSMINQIVQQRAPAASGRQ